MPFGEAYLCNARPLSFPAMFLLQTLFFHRCSTRNSSVLSENLPSLSLSFSFSLLRDDQQDKEALTRDMDRKKGIHLTDRFNVRLIALDSFLIRCIIIIYLYPASAFRRTSRRWNGKDGMETRSKNVISSVEEAATRERILRWQRTDPTENYSRISEDRDFLFVKKNRPPLRKWKTEDTPLLSFRIERNKGFLSKSLGELFARRARPRREVVKD